MLFYPSFTQSERFLQTDQFIIRLQVVVVTNFISMLMRSVFVNVFESDAVIRWAAIFCTPSSMFDKLLRLSKGFAMSCSRCCNFCGAAGNLLTVTMHLQDTLSKFQRPGLHKIHLCVHVASASTRTLAFLTNPRAAELSVHGTIIPDEDLRSCDTLASSTNQRHQLGFTRTQTNHVLFLGKRTHGIPRVLNRTFDPNCNSRKAATVFDVSSPISVGHHHDRTLRNVATVCDVVVQIRPG